MRKVVNMIIFAVMAVAIAWLIPMGADRHAFEALPAVFRWYFLGMGIITMIQFKAVVDKIARWIIKNGQAAAAKANSPEVREAAHDAARKARGIASDAAGTAASAFRNATKKAKRAGGEN